VHTHREERTRITVGAGGEEAEAEAEWRGESREEVEASQLTSHEGSIGPVFRVM
jgi:hypothetical protein